MDLAAEDIKIHEYVCDDGSDSAAIKVAHRTLRQQAICNDTDSQWQNCRRALFDLVATMNPNPELIPIPDLMVFDRVRVSLPQSVHEGRITRLSWDYPRSEWQFYVTCPNEAVTSWYIAADLYWLDQDQ